MEIICQLLGLYLLVIIAGALLSWIPAQHGGGLHQARVAIARLTDPVMMPVRRSIGASFGGIDFSPLIVILGINLLRQILC